MYFCRRRRMKQRAAASAGTRAAQHAAGVSELPPDQRAPAASGSSQSQDTAAVSDSWRGQKTAVAYDLPSGQHIAVASKLQRDQHILTHATVASEVPQEVVQGPVVDHVQQVTGAQPPSGSLQRVQPASTEEEEMAVSGGAPEGYDSDALVGSLPHRALPSRHMPG